MSIYTPLWKYIQETDKEELLITFEEINKVLGFNISHSFLSFKKELLEYNYEIEKISLKNKTVLFKKIK